MIARALCGLAFASLALAAGGCGGSAPATCASSADCPASAPMCSSATGTCVACLADRDCAASQYCAGGTCKPAVACTTSRTCSGQVCDTAAGYCADCAADGDCTGGLRCTLHACVAPPPSCTSDRDCSARGLVCDVAASTCVECVHDTDCAGGLCGTDRRCHAAPDAGPPDAGPPDAGPPDAGLDGPPGPSHAALALTWTIQTSTGATSTCDALGATTVDVTLSPVTSGTPITRSLPCDDLHTDFPGLALGGWYLDLQAKASSGVPVGGAMGRTLTLAPTGCDAVVGGDCVHSATAQIRPF